MKKVERGYLLRFLLISFISVFLHTQSPAQPWPNDPFGSGSPGNDPGDIGTEDPGDPNADPDLQVPIDSNVLILVVAVVGYGLKKMLDVKRNSGRKNNLASAARFEDFIK